MNYFMGIDPGKSGAVAVVGEDRSVRTIKNSVTERDLLEFICSWGPLKLFEPKTLFEQHSGFVKFALIEKVHPFPGKRKIIVCSKCGFRQAMTQPQGVSSTGKLMQSYGFVRASIHAARIPFQEIGPGSWQQKIGIPRRGNKTQTEHKNVLKSRAQQLFPGHKIIHATADAILLAELCRRIHGRRAA
jgi:hypothetical protein